MNESVLVFRNKILVSNDLPNNSEIEKAMGEISRLVDLDVNKVNFLLVLKALTQVDSDVLSEIVEQIESRCYSCIQACSSHLESACKIEC